jgi:glucose/arabinose dehydrogenase/plastocyanin
MGTRDATGWRDARTLRRAALFVAVVGLLAGPAAVAAGDHGSTPVDEAPAHPASHDSAGVPGVAEGFLAHAIADAQAPTAITFHPGPDVADDLPSTGPVTEDLYYANLNGEIVHVDLAWTPLGPAAVDRTVVADGFDQPLGVAFDDEGTMYVSDSYDHEAADRPVGVVYALDPATGDREAIVDGVPNGQHNINHLRFGPDDRLYLPVGNPNDSGNGTGTGHTDIFPYTGAFLSVDTDRLADEGPAVLYWEDGSGTAIDDDELVDHPRNQDFADKVDVLAFGFRNIFDITWAPEDLPFAGAAYTGTNGADNPNSQDTVERIQPGAHHGYPFCISTGAPGQTEELAKEHWAGSPHTDFDCQRSPPAEALLGYHVCATGIDFPSDPEPGHPDFSFPEDRSSSLFVGECAFFQAQNTIQENLEHASRHNTAHKVSEVELDETGDAQDVDAFLEGLALPTDVQFGPDGAMYVADAGTILRVAPTPAASAFPGELVPEPLKRDQPAPVAAVGNSFLPQALVVPTGTALAWTGGPLAHTVTSSQAVCSSATEDECRYNADDDTAFNGLVGGVGDTFEHTFEEAGVYPYYCEFHYQLGMTGLVVAVDPGDPTAVGPEDVVQALGVDQAQQAPGLAHGAGDGHGHVHAPS